MPTARDNFGSIPVRGTGKLEKLTLEELAWWQAIADETVIRFDMRPEDKSFHAICMECGQSVMRLSSHDGFFLSFRVNDLTTQVVSHLRNVHRELGNARTEATRNADVAGSGNGSADTAD